MALTNWTKETGVIADLNSTYKHGGNSSFRVKPTSTSNGIIRGNSQQAVVYVWHYTKTGQNGDFIVGHLSYGNILLIGAWTPQDVWARWRFSFWYDSANNTRFGKVEIWEGGGWVQKGTDTNFGSGSPALNPIRLGRDTINYDSYFDDIEVYEESV